MVYVTADLHGYPLKDFQQLLNRAHFCDDDFLFVLGDVIDRNGDGGIEMLQWMTMQPNVELILGNHEAMLLACRFILEEVTEEYVRHLSIDKIGSLENWLYNGAKPTILNMQALRKKDPEALNSLIEYLQEAPLYDTVSAGDKDFLLVHAGLGGFAKDKPLSSYDPDDLLWYRPKPEERFYDDVITILGHTPTKYYNMPNRMLQTPTWIDIDTGAAGGGAPMLLRLDDLQPFYIDS